MTVLNLNSIEVVKNKRFFLLSGLISRHKYTHPLHRMATQSTSIEFDKTIFQNEEKPTIRTDKCYEDYNKCMAIKRLLASLSYYAKLDPDDNDIFCDFMLSAYGTQVSTDNLTGC